MTIKKCVVERYSRDSYLISDYLPLFTITDESQLERIFTNQLEKTSLKY